MTRSEAETTVRSAIIALLTLVGGRFDADRRFGHDDSSTRHRIHDATLLLAEAIVTSGRMPDPEAIAALTLAAELAAEILLRGFPRMTGALEEIVDEKGSELLTLSHRNAVDQAVSGSAAANPDDSNRPVGCDAVPSR